MVSKRNEHLQSAVRKTKVVEDFHQRYYRIMSAEQGSGDAGSHRCDRSMIGIGEVGANDAKIRAQSGHEERKNSQGERLGQIEGRNTAQ